MINGERVCTCGHAASVHATHGDSQCFVEGCRCRRFENAVARACADRIKSDGESRARVTRVLERHLHKEEDR